MNLIKKLIDWYKVHFNKFTAEDIPVDKRMEEILLHNRELYKALYSLEIEDIDFIRDKNEISPSARILLGEDDIQAFKVYYKDLDKPIWCAFNWYHTKTYKRPTQYYGLKEAFIIYTYNDNDKFIKLIHDIISVSDKGLPVVKSDSYLYLRLRNAWLNKTHKIAQEKDKEKMDLKNTIIGLYKIYNDTKESKLLKVFKQLDR